MTKEQKQHMRKVKKLIWQIRWIMVKYWISNRLIDIAAIMEITGLIITTVLAICIMMICICIAYILDILVSLLTFKKHRNACNWLGNKLIKLERWGRDKLKGKESE